MKSCVHQRLASEKCGGFGAVDVEWIEGMNIRP